MNNNKTINKEYYKTIHLRGRKEIEDFFRDEYIGREDKLNEFVDSLLKNPNETITTPLSMEVDGKEYILNRRVVHIVLHHNMDT